MSRPPRHAPMKQHEAEDLFVRFFLNCPADHLSTIDDFSVILLDAVWYYLAVYRHDRGTTAVSDQLMGECCRQFFGLVPPLAPYIPLIGAIRKANAKLQRSAATYGCICLNPEMTHVVVVHHVQRRRAFSFPKGKAREGESGLEAAARETLEEAGIDVADVLTDAGAIRYERRGKSAVTMYFATGIAMGPLASPSPLEIAMVRWTTIESIGADGEYQADQKTRAMLEKIQAFVGARRAQA
jgi:8-oxo-dGTP pyrophosphatase MutT (NUDIX family)